MRFDKLPAALFAALFFAALPTWFLSTLEGPTQFSCGGAPWRCTVSRWVFFETKSASYEPVKVSSETRQRTSKRGSFPESRVTVTLPAGSVVAVTDWGDEENWKVARTLDEARTRQATVVLERPAAAIFWFAVFLVVLFAGVGLFIVFGSGSPRAISRGRPE